MALQLSLVRPRLAAAGRQSRLKPSRPARRGYSTDAPFTYRLGASSSGKTSAPSHPDQRNTFTNALVDKDPPYFSSVPRFSGEDAFFMAQVARSSRYVVCGVADGVGGWQDQGIDPGDFSHGLCRYMAEKTHRPESEHDLRPRNLLQHAYDMVSRDRKIVAGGSTACVASLEPSGSLEVANLGDSGFVILSPGNITHKSPAQTHAFNTPYQLSKLTPRMQAQNRIFGNSAQISESPSDSDVTNHSLRHGELVVIASDGVWDNLSAMDVMKVVSPIMEKRGYWSASSPGSRGLEPKESIVKADNLRSVDGAKAVADLPAELAYAVMRAAKLASLDTRRDGPFAKEVHKHFPGEAYHGGKVDDISVIVCLALQDAAPKAKL